MSQYNLRHYLEGQSDRAEAVLAAHRAPARITGGTVGPRLIRLFLNPAPHTRFSTIRGLTDDLVRLVGKVVSAEDARVATGRDKTAAHNLSGRGDFLAVSGHALPIRFQTAFIAEQDARKEVAQV